MPPRKRVREEDSEGEKTEEEIENGKLVRRSTRATRATSRTAEITSFFPSKKAKTDVAVSASSTSHAEDASSPSASLSSSSSTSSSPAAVGTWTRDGSLLFFDCGSTPSTKIAGFDMDGTLITPKSGAKFPKDAKDWRWLFPSVVSKLQELNAEGYKVVIFTNQKGISTGRASESDVTDKISAMAAQLGFGLQALVATEDDWNRKPCLGMWQFLQAKANQDTPIDASQSFFCGDAAGRPKRGAAPKDHSAADFKFALNLKLRFETPESIFLGQKQTISETFEFDPRKLPVSAGPDDASDKRYSLARDSQELVLIVGSAASGKSTLTTTFFSNYVRVNQDTLGSKPKCISAVKQALSSGKSAVVDNQNKDALTRREYIKIAKDLGIPARAVFIVSDAHTCFHLNSFRLMNPRSTDKRKVPNMIIYSFFKNVEKPTLAEGFDEVIELPFLGGPFACPEDQEMFNMFLTE
eukprot:GILI01017494.1.p1 GENE.GILI01017494.1~~GILI01017494.1.p1  ORF type:complete len:467 (-),score=102.75 GILI01017494.1:70-1470(-)